MGNKRTILIVDDQEPNREVLSAFVVSIGYNAIAAEEGMQALDVMRSESVDLVLLDIMMPRMSGYELLEIMKQDAHLTKLPVIIISALDEMESMTRCLESGADDYHTKPFKSRILEARIRGCLAKKLLADQEEEHKKQIEEVNRDLELHLVQRMKQISASDKAMIFALSNLAESRDPDTGEYLFRMREYTRRIAIEMRELSLHENVIDEAFIQNLYVAAPLHDIGKVGIPDRILLKPGRLTSEEFSIMQQHSTIGAETLRNVNEQYGDNEYVAMGIRIAQSHHEKWNGRGYPEGLSGEDIPLGARILGLADVYDALTSKRCYKEAFSHEESVEIIRDGRGEHFDPVIVDAFLELEHEFPQIRHDFEDSEKVLLQ